VDPAPLGYRLCRPAVGELLHQRSAVLYSLDDRPGGLLDVREDGLHYLLPLDPVGDVGEGAARGVDAEVGEHRVRRSLGLQRGPLRLRGGRVVVEQVVGQLMRQALDFLVVGEGFPEQDQPLLGRVEAVRPGEEGVQLKFSEVRRLTSEGGIMLVVERLRTRLENPDGSAKRGGDG
jgi:hypothetical protein